MKTALEVAVLAALALPVVLFIGIALGPVILVFLLIGAWAAPLLLGLGAVSFHAHRH